MADPGQDGGQCRFADFERVSAEIVVLQLKSEQTIAIVATRMDRTCSIRRPEGAGSCVIRGTFDMPSHARERDQPLDVIESAAGE
jgi:hypothetical protein